MLSTAELEAIVTKLCHASERDYNNPYTYIEWVKELDRRQWFFTPELISLYGSETYNEMSETQQQLLSFYEAVNFFSLNIHGERSLMEGLAHRLHRRNYAATSAYLHHFLDEENKHMIYFAGFCTRYAGKIYSERKLLMPRDYAEGEDDFLFFAKVLIFEEIVDCYNIKMSLDSRLVSLARDINHAHHKDESRHLVFGRQIVKDLFETSSKEWDSDTLAQVRQHLAEFFVLAWKEYYNPDVYKDAGLPSPYELQKQIFSSEVAAEQRRRISKPCIQYFIDNKILLKEPKL